MDAAPWGTSSVNSWLLDIISTCVDPDMAATIVPKALNLLLSDSSDDALQYPLFEILGDKSFDVIQTMLSTRNQIKGNKTKRQAFNDDNNNINVNEQESQKKQKMKAITLKKTVPIARSSAFRHTESVNMSRYDVDAPSIKRPKVQHVEIKELPKWARECFRGCDRFNEIQSIVFNQAFHKTHNMLISAPTGAGKTNVALLTVLQEIKRHIVEKPGLPSLVNQNDKFLIVYITPMKALAAEIKEKFTTSLRHLKVNVKEYTGDTRISAEELYRSHILVATPEKWDIATRRGGEDTIGSRLKLLIIDEIHLLQDDRGPVLEALVARTLRQVEQTQSKIRIVGLSATLPNCQDVASFLKVPDEGLFIFGPEFRPVPLAMTLLGAKNTDKTPIAYKELYEELYQKFKDKDVIQIDIVAIQLIQEIIKDGYQALIFVHTRGETSRFANLIANHLQIPYNSELNSLMSKKGLQPELKECLIKGVGIHHAGLPRGDRNFVENAFRQNKFPILVSTATLAWGVNLPAHTVIIKDTKVYNQEQGGYENIGILDVHQMFGRAGRPQFDTSGHAILIATNKVLSKYTTTLVNAEPIESKFSNRVEDFLNAEISLGTVTCKNDALKWIRYTFMYQMNPDDELYSKRLDFAANELNRNSMIRTSIATDSLQPTHLGQVASMHYIPFKAVSHFNEKLSGEMSEADLLDCIFSSGMFQSLIVRSSEMNDLENFRSTIPVLTPFYEIPGKVNILFQAFISRYIFRKSSLALDECWIADNIQRVFDAIFELAIEKGWCFIAIFTLNLCKMVEHQMWWAPSKKDHPLFQILKGNKYVSLLKRIQSIDLKVDEIKSLKTDELRRLLHNNPLIPELQTAAKRFPCINIGVRYQPMSMTIVSIIINVIFPFEWNKSILHEVEYFWVFIQEYDGSEMYHSQEVMVDKKIAKEGLELQVLVPLAKSGTYLISMSSERFLGVEDTQELSIKDAHHSTFEQHETVIPPQIKPLKVNNVISNKNTLKVFNGNQNRIKIEQFNIIQSMIFHQAYHTNDSLLVCAPTSSGKTTIAELAICQMLEISHAYRAVYIVPLKSTIKERVNDWKGKFHCQIAELSDRSPDINAISHARIIIATPERWDSFSVNRCAKQLLKQITLLIIDEVHLLGTSRGHIIETIIQRMRGIYDSSCDQSLENLGYDHLRIIGLSNNLSNPFDIAQFLGVPYRGVYNFSQKQRNPPLITFVRGFPGRQYGPRMAAMNKPISDAIIEKAHGNPTLLFVSSRRQTRMTAQDLVSFSLSTGNEYYYYTEEAAQAAQNAKDKDLAKFLFYGVGLHHAGLVASDLELVEGLFAKGKLKLLIATSSFAWGTKLPAYFVVIKGTEFFDVKTGQYVPYTAAEMQQMINRAGRPNIDQNGLVMIFCEESKQKFLNEFISSKFPIESTMLSYIYDHINAEISCGQITDKRSLMKWLEKTYFAIRLNKNPRYYNNTTLTKVAENTIQILEKSECITVSKDTNSQEKPSNIVNERYCSTKTGRIGAIFYVSYVTVQMFLDRMNVASQSVSETLEIICSAREFQEIPMRRGEDEIVSHMTPRFRKEGSSKSKVFFIVQYYLSRRKLPAPDFDADLGFILDLLPRIIGCYIELCAARKNLPAMINGVLVHQMIIQGIWFDDNPLKAILKEATMKDLKNRLDIRTLPQLLLMENLPSGLLPICQRILLYSSNEKDRCFTQDKNGFSVLLKRIYGTIGNSVLSSYFSNRDIQSAYIILGNPSTGEVLCHRRVKLEEEEIRVLLKANKEITDTCWIYIMFDSYIGLDQMYNVAGSCTTKELFLKPKKYINIKKTRHSNKNDSQKPRASQIQKRNNDDHQINEPLKNDKKKRNRNRNERQKNPNNKGMQNNNNNSNSNNLKHLNNTDNKDQSNQSVQPPENKIVTKKFIPKTHLNSQSDPQAKSITLDDSTGLKVQRPVKGKGSFLFQIPSRNETQTQNPSEQNGPQINQTKEQSNLPTSNIQTDNATQTNSQAPNQNAQQAQGSNKKSKRKSKGKKKNNPFYYSPYND